MLLFGRPRGVIVSADALLLTVALVFSGSVAWALTRGGAWGSTERALTVGVALVLLVGGVATIKVVYRRGSDVHVRSLFRRHRFSRTQCAFAVQRDIVL